MFIPIWILLFVVIFIVKLLVDGNSNKSKIEELEEVVDDLGNAFGE